MTMKAKAVMIDPESCDSTVVIKFAAPKIKQYKSRMLLADEDDECRFFVGYDARVSLSDCNRWIEWDFRSHMRAGYNIAKLDKAIKALSEFRRELVKAESKRKVLAEKVKQKNDALKKQKEKKSAR